MNFKKLQAMQAKLDEAILADKAPMTETVAIITACYQYL